MSWPCHDGVFSLGDVQVEHGGIIRDAKLAWQSHGDLNAARDNAIVYPCSFRAQHTDLAWLIGPDGILDPGRWFIVIPDMFSNGRSSGAAETPEFPALVSSRDNVLAQRRLLTELFGVSGLAAAYGYSMGAQQAYHWAALFPENVERAIIVCGTARTSTHNKVFISGLLRTLEAAPEHLGGGRFSAEPAATLRAFGHLYAGWARSQDFYRAELHRSVLGAPDLDTYLETDWAASFGACRAANLYAQLRTWQHGDISANPRYDGDLVAALGSIRARVLLLPSRTDLYFPVADSAAELPHLVVGELRPIPSVWGHGAGNPVATPADRAFLKDAVRDWLDRPTPS